MPTEITAAQSSTPLTKSMAELTSAIGRLDVTLTDDECQIALAYLNDNEPAGLEEGKVACRSIMSVYPKNDAANPEAFSLAVSMVLSEYPVGVLKRLSDPRTSIITRRIKFMPRLSEIVDACDEEMNRRDWLRDCVWAIMQREKISLRDWHDRTRRHKKSKTWDEAFDAIETERASGIFYDPVRPI
jgi:hypothetical protein